MGGVLADRVGYKAVLASWTLFVFLSPLGALLVGGLAGVDASVAQEEGQSAAFSVLGIEPFGLILTFVFLGAYLAAYHTSAMPVILEFCAPEDRPTYVGLTNTILAPILIGGPILGGWVAESLGFETMFGTALAVGAVALVLMMLWVEEPRRTTPRSVEEERAKVRL